MFAVIKGCIKDDTLFYYVLFIDFWTSFYFSIKVILIKSLLLSATSSGLGYFSTKLHPWGLFNGSYGQLGGDYPLLGRVVLYLSDRPCPVLLNAGCGHISQSAWHPETFQRYFWIPSTLGTGYYVWLRIKSNCNWLDTAIIWNGAGRGLTPQLLGAIYVSQ